MKIFTKLALAAILMATPMFPLCLNAGGPTTANTAPTGGATCVADTPYAIGGTAYLQPDMGPGVYGTLRYGLNGAPFSHSITVDPGVYLVTLDFVDPNKTAAGQRSFTVTINGQVYGPIDVLGELAQMAGCPANMCLTNAGTSRRVLIKHFVVTANSGTIRIDYAAKLNNAIVNRVAVDLMQATAVSFQLGAGLAWDNTTVPPTLIATGVAGSPGPTLGRVDNETPTKSGVANTFMLSRAPVEGTEQVYLNGLHQEPNYDYTLNGQTLTFIALAIKDEYRVQVSYQVAP